MSTCKAIIDKLCADKILTREDLGFLLNNYNSDSLLYINRLAQQSAESVFGREIYIRGLIEITNRCRNNCLYCGIRRDNRNLERYLLSKNEILECCRNGYAMGFRTFVLQGGEGVVGVEAIENIVAAIHAEFADAAITLSLGEYDRATYQRWFDAGADRYLLRHETADRNHYERIHPAEMSFDNRRRCLADLKEIGYQTGSGIMVGSPFQTVESLIEDIEYLAELQPEMIGIGPFVPQKDTPLADFKAGSVDMTLMLISVLRIMMPDVLIPSTTALASIADDGRERGILAGANVVMPNLSPSQQRRKYAIYDNKKSLGLESAEGLAELEKQLNGIGYRISESRGDHHKTKNNV